MNLPLLVMAAGMGSRFGGLKQVVPVGPVGETIIDYSVFDAARAGFDVLVFVIRRDIESEFRDAIGRRFEKRIAVEYVFQEIASLPDGFQAPPSRKKPWGTGHAVLMGARAIQEPFAVINGDDFYGASSFAELAKHLRGQKPAHAMVGFTLANTLSEFGSVSRGVCAVAADGGLKGVTELTRIERHGAAARSIDSSGRIQELTGREIVSMNMWGFTPSIFDDLREQFSAFLRKSGGDDKAEFYIPTVVNEIVASDRAQVKVLTTADSWFGITYPDDRARASEGIRRLIAAGRYPEKL